MNNGIHYGLARELYDQVNRAHWSTLKLLGQSPAHYHHGLTEGVPDTSPKRLGRCAHVATLEPERLRSDFVVYPKRRAGKEWDAFEAKHAGLEIIKPNEHRSALAIQRAVRNSAAAKYVSGGKSEVSLLWTYNAPALGGLPEVRIDLKGRVDFEASVGALVDLKSTIDASPAGFGREAFRYRYHVQAALYSDGYFALTGKRLPYKLVAVESKAPHVVQVYTVPERLLEIGREDYSNLLGRLELCRSENSWPGYFDGEGELELPTWATFDHEDEDVSGLDLDFTDAAPAAGEQ